MAQRAYTSGLTVECTRETAYNNQDRTGTITVKIGDRIILLDQTGTYCTADTTKKTWRFLRRGVTGLIGTDYLDAYFRPPES